MVDALVRHAGVKPGEIAFFTQRDAYGDAGFSGGTMALRRHQLTNELEILHVRYERNTLAVEKALATLIEQEVPPKAVIMVGAYAPCAQFIRLAREHGLDAIFLNVSFVGSTSLARALGDAGDGVVVTQVVPHYSSDRPIVSDYRTAFQRLDPSGTPSFGSLEGYVAVRILCRALSSISGEPNREKVVDSLEALGRFDIGLGEPLTLSKEEHQACHHVWPTVVRGGKVVPFEWKELGRRRRSHE